MQVALSLSPDLGKDGFALWLYIVIVEG